MEVAAALTTRLQAPDGPVQVRVWPAERADPGAPVLLACHGWSDSGEVFGPLAAALDHRWTVVAPDAPGHGGTPRRPGRYAVADHATGVAAVVDALPRVAGRAAPVVAMGHSMGALTATRVAAARPGVVAALVLEDPARTTTARPRSSNELRTTLLELRAGDHAARVRWAAETYPDWPAAELEPWACSKEEVDLSLVDRPVDWGQPLPALLGAVTVPVLMVRGEPGRGGLVSATVAARCAAACPGPVSVLSLPVGHCPRREATAAFVASLAHVLRTARQHRD